MANPVTPPERIEQRVEDNVRAWLATDAFLGRYALRERDENSLVFPEGEIPRPVLVVECKDEGRAFRLTPIRNVRCNVIVRANTKTPGGDPASFSAIVGALEILLDTTNLLQALSGPKVAIMLGVRSGGIGFRTNGLVREGTVSLELKAVAAELTTTGQAPNR